MIENSLTIEGGDEEEDRRVLAFIAYTSQRKTNALSRRCLRALRRVTSRWCTDRRCVFGAE